MNKKQFFSNIGLAFLLFILLMIGVEIALVLIIDAISPWFLYMHPNLDWAISFIPQYAVAMPVCFLIMKRLPAMRLYKNRMKPGNWFSTLCIALFIMEVGNIIGNLVCALLYRATGLQTAYTVEDMLTGTSLWLSFLVTVIAAPILEELIFRKVLIDRAIVFGDRTAILLSGLIFGLVHGNFYQFFYAFGLGCLFGYIYIRTGKLRYTISFHMVINFLGGFLISFLLERADLNLLTGLSSPQQLSWYFYSHLGALVGIFLLAVLLLVLFIIGIVQLVRSVKKRILNPGEYSMPRKETAKTLFGNPGMILFLIGAVWLFLLNMLP